MDNKQKWWFVDLPGKSAVIRAPHITAALDSAKAHIKGEKFELKHIIEIEEDDPRWDTLCIVGVLHSPATL